MTDIGLSRRGLLRLLAGAPLALGLPDLAWAEEPTVEEAIALARAAGRPILLLGLHDPDAELDERWDPLRQRRRLARRLHALLTSSDPETRLALANAVIVVDQPSALREAVPALPRGSDPQVAPAWLLSPGAEPESLDGGLDHDDAAAERLRVALVARVIGGDELTPLLARREAERARLDPATLARVERDLRVLGSPDPYQWAAAREALSARRGRLLALLTLAALGEPGRDVRERASEIVLRGGAPEQPLGTEWGEFRGDGCGSSDPYDEDSVGTLCGMGSVDLKARPVLNLLR